jgi:uncharacterized protein YjaZ
VQRDYKSDTCYIFIVERVLDYDCTIAHERKHCAGYGHPNYTEGGGCAMNAGGLLPLSFR